MDRKVEYIGIIVGNILNAIAVVNIPVQDEDTLCTLCVDGVLCSDSNVVEEAKT